MTDNCINIVYSCSNEYSELAAVSIISILENNRDADNICFYIIDKGISMRHKDEIRDMVSLYRRKLVYLPDIDVEKISGTKIVVFKWNLSTFSRLFLLHVLPENVSKVIYIDCDTIVRHSLLPLWNEDMDGAWVMAADDCRGTLYRKDIGIPEDSIYTNNGVMVIDLDAWRRNSVEEMFIRFIKKHKGNVTYVDQGVVNGALQPLKKIKLLPLRYNLISACVYLGYDGLDLCRNPVWAYTKEEFKEALEDPVIVHFTSCFIAGSRPWEKEDSHPFRDEFLLYRKMTPWCGCALWENKEPLVKQADYWICKRLPRQFVLKVVRILHVWGFPLSRMLRRGGG